MISKGDLTSQLINLDNEKERLEERLSPIEEQIEHGGIPNVYQEVVKEIMQNFMTVYKKALTPRIT